MIKPDLLKSFIASADCGSFSAAARVLGKHLTTVSGNVAKLEDDLGVMLFDREGKYPQLTEAGRNLYDGAKVAVESIERFQRNAQQLSIGIPATMMIAIDEELALQPFLSLLKTLQKNWPHLTLTILSLTPEEILQRVREQRIDLAITPTLEGNSQFYEFRAIGNCMIDIVCAQSHPLAKQRTISNDDLMAHTQIISPSTRSPAVLRESAKMSSSILESNGYHNFLSLIRAELGWGFLHRLNQQPIHDIVSIRPEFVQTQLQVQYDVIWQKNQPITEVHSFIIERIKHIFSNHAFE
ncbi:LysR family transcriptional regulator [Vibrio sp. ZSDZ65]|uniref:LysR family transcriptional regulator n=1 Tax=Vibrio qingdaonensis TaxID=2829491 RepID=A0A9X3HXC3_9VIBR|nr:LysR family transcriptional regulator [Vibrio qingdaonensis]MCW8347179.1 LysR family transcriptional regulator [Vibrio qingdaonensis]